MNNDCRYIAIWTACLYVNSCGYIAIQTACLHINLCCHSHGPESCAYTCRATHSAPAEHHPRRRRDVVPHHIDHCLKHRRQLCSAWQPETNRDIIPWSTFHERCLDFVHGSLNVFRIGVDGRYVESGLCCNGYVMLERGRGFFWRILGRGSSCLSQQRRCASF